MTGFCLAPSFGEPAEKFLVEIHYKQPFGVTSGWMDLPNLNQPSLEEELNPTQEYIANLRRQGEEEKAAQLEALFQNTRASLSSGNHFAQQFLEDFITASTSDPAGKFSILKHLLEQEPENLILRTDIGTVLLELRRPEEAVGHFRKVVEKRQDWDRAWNDLGVALIQSGKIGEGKRCLLRGLQIASDSPEILYNLGDLAVRLHQPAEARSMLQRLRQLGTPYSKLSANRLEIWMRHPPIP